MMKTAILTGASAGLGRLFIKHIPEFFPEIEEIWLIARRRELLELAAAESAIPCRVLPMDLSLDSSYRELARIMAEESTDVRLLINNSGCGYLGNVGEGDVAEQIRMIDVNVKCPTALTHVTLPHMEKGGRIINISSIASFCPNPRMTVYSSTKAYLTAFTEGIYEELRPKGITATAVCPGPMATEFLALGNIKGNSKTFDTLPYCDPEKVAVGALKAARRGKRVYTPRAFYKLYRVIAKLTPAALMMKISKT